MRDWAQRIRACFESGAVYYTGHAKAEMEQEEFGTIRDEEVAEAVETAEVIEEYPDDRPYPSALLYGRTKAGRPIHLVCAYVLEEDRVIVITVYQPDPARWIDYRERRPQ